ncbi:MAG: gamma-glutamyl-gamma-aminobutyrate hydrolase family protein [Bacteroidales bacterium]|nr:gamma-glutamyl-gamma-aminobutyrate hydrolase family protein [Bacteroidales bacterium]
MKTRYYYTTFIFLLGTVLVLLCSSCVQKPEPVSTVIGISKGAPLEYYGNYSKWLSNADTTIICIDLYHMPVDSALSKLEDCSGLLLSGGPDVYPGRYGQLQDTLKCGPPDLFRDGLEFALIARAKELKMPILGICRGLQIFNIYHGGSLYADLPTDPGTTISHRCPDTYDCFHHIEVDTGSGLFKTAGESAGTVNSNHHQGIDRLGKGLSAIAYTDDSLIESIEYANHDQMPFFLGVQWHPERMDIQNPFSLPVAMYFIQEAKLFSIQHSTK